jgi:HD-like signal output (HDOD) protein
VEEISSTINIPSQPKVMQEINAEFLKKEIDFSRVAGLVSRDVGLSAKLLKVANSPLFAAKARVESIDQALMLLGTRQFKQTILASALRQAMESTGVNNEEFWNHSESIGLICDFIARKLQPEVAEYAYLTGLFHDCAIPILLGRNDGFSPLVPRALARDRTVQIEEERECEIEHASLGLVMARSWSIPIPIVKVIRAHHSDDFQSHSDPVTAHLHVILAIAENYYLYARRTEEEIFGDTRNNKLIAGMQTTTGWSESQILSLGEALEAKF